LAVPVAAFPSIPVPDLAVVVRVHLVEELFLKFHELLARHEPLFSVSIMCMTSIGFILRVAPTSAPRRSSSGAGARDGCGGDGGEQNGSREDAAIHQLNSNHGPFSL